MAYISVRTILDALENHYHKTGAMQTLPGVIAELCTRPEVLAEEMAEPLFAEAHLLSDDEFIRLFSESPFPVDAFLRRYRTDAWRTEAPVSYQYEMLHVFRHLNFALQGAHLHNFFEVNYVFSGRCTAVFENQRIEMTAGHTCIIAPMSNHEIIIDDPDTVVFNIGMKKESFECAFRPIMLQNELIATYLRTILYQKNMPNYLYIPAENTEEMKSQLKQITCESRIFNPYVQSIAINRIGIFFCLILKNYQHTIHLQGRSNPSIQEEYMTLLQYIQNNYASVTLESVARHFSYNKTYLSRLISKLTGKSFSQTITELRMNNACNMLLYSDLKISEIADRCGYETLDYFSKVFKKQFQISPAAYRKQAGV